MPFNEQILVVINPEKDEQVALDRAIRISESLGACITVLVRKKHAIPKLMETLDQKLNTAVKKGIAVSVVISNERNWLGALTCTLREKNFGLVIKELHAPSLSDHVFLPDDWKLMRNTNQPVLLVRAGNIMDQQPVLLCVNAAASDAEHLLLNERILKEGRFIAEAVNAPMHLVSAFPSQMQDGDKSLQVPALQEAQYRAGCRRLLGEMELPESQIHVDQGPAELLIPQVVEEIGAHLVVIGTVARLGLQGFLLGNTAEQVLHRLRTDVLVDVLVLPQS
ncbi:universal stress protein [Amphritea japonica]|uniref:Universal stress protein n=1 Tax=Amphritea japonica ATCC BAA-1530 TaxID=1278309 RepID=A0A7R6STV5_9GAMM|nr:universal stress protein [Amphritea japonica]BBB27105.1 universal stress protein [Amphritea japonica ATCC BAA-1530]